MRALILALALAACSQPEPEPYVRRVPDRLQPATVTVYCTDQGDRFAVYINSSGHAAAPEYDGPCDEDDRTQRKTVHLP